MKKETNFLLVKIRAVETEILNKSLKRIRILSQLWIMLISILKISVHLWMSCSWCVFSRFLYSWQTSNFFTPFFKLLKFCFVYFYKNNTECKIGKMGHCYLWIAPNVTYSWLCAINFTFYFALGLFFPQSALEFMVHRRQ